MNERAYDSLRITAADFEVQPKLTDVARIEVERMCEAYALPPETIMALRDEPHRDFVRRYHEARQQADQFSQQVFERWLGENAQGEECTSSGTSSSTAA